MSKKNKNENEKIKDNLEEDNLIASMHQFKEYIEPEYAKAAQKVIKEIPIERYHQWYLDEYAKQVPQTTLAPTKYEDGMLKRISNISVMKYLSLFDMTHSSIVIFKLNTYHLKKETNYATLFCENMNNIIPHMKSAQMLENDIIHGNTVFMYANTSTSFISCDGEYKMRLVRYHDINLAKLDYPELWTDLEEYIDKIIKSRRWSIYPSYFHSKTEGKHVINTEIEQAVKNELVAKTLLIISWFHTIYNEMLSLTETHLNSTFKEILLENVNIDIEFMHQLIKKYGIEAIEKFKIQSSHTIIPIFGTGNKRYIPLGFKMIPLNVREVQDPIRLKYKPWREFLISNRCNDFVINQISPCFSIISDWFYVRNSKKGLFDNKTQYERLKHSELARDILRALYEAQRGTYFATSGIVSTSKSSEHIKQWLSNKFKKLNEKIYEPINYSIEEIIMSDITLAFASEYVGRTYADTITIISKSRAYDTLIGKPFSDQGYDYGCKYLFEICYSLLALNSKLGVIHGDFHLNNATIGFLYKPTGTNTKVSYQIDKNHTLIFPNNGYFSCIIDFSRGMINPENADVLADPGIPSSYKIIKDYDKFSANEASLLLNLYMQLFPNKSKQKEELAVLFKNNYSAVFKLLSCIDIYMFTVRLSRYLRQTNINAGKKILDLIDKINRLSEIFIATDMNHLLNDTERMSEKILAEDWPMHQIIKKCFPEYIDGKAYKNIGTIIDSYTLENELKYSLAKYDLFPEVLKYAKYYKDASNKTTEDIQQITNNRRQLRSDYEKKKLENLEQVKYLSIKYSTFVEDQD
jgi:hypothetical protein